MRREEAVRARDGRVFPDSLSSSLSEEEEDDDDDDELEEVVGKLKEGAGSSCSASSSGSVVAREEMGERVPLGSPLVIGGGEGCSGELEGETASSSTRLRLGVEREWKWEV